MIGQVPDFDEIKVGDYLGHYEYRLTPGRALQYVEATEDEHPWYDSPSPFGGPIAPPNICDADASWLPGSWWKIIAGGTLDRSKRQGFAHVKQVYEYLNPAFPGKKIRVCGHVADKYVKDNRRYVTVEALSIDEDNREIVRSFTTYSWRI